MKRKAGALFLVFPAVVFSLSALALTGADVSPVTPLETVSPTVQSAAALTERSLSVTFSEPLLAPGAAAPGNHVVSGAGRGMLAPSPDTVTGSGPYTLTWTAGEMRDGAAVTVTVSGVQDAVGNPLLSAGASASATGLGVAPVFSGLSATPSLATVDDTVAIAFTVSEPLDGDPVVLVNGRPAAWVSGDKATDFTYHYEVAVGDMPGMASLSVSGYDLAGNLGLLNDASLLEITGTEAGLPAHSWPFAFLLLVTGAAVLLRARRTGMSGGRAFLLVVLFALPVLLCASAFAAPPVVSSVSVVQQDNGVGGTAVIITYDLEAPNGPCDVMVSLSKEGGADGYVFPVISVTGDVADVAGGAGKQIVWDIRADFPEEALPDARIRVTADDEPVMHALTYLAGAGGTVTGDSPQTVNHGTDGTPVTAVPDTGHRFVRWSDGVPTATRQDTGVMADITVTADFEQLPFPVVTSFAINGGAAATMSVAVTLDNTVTNGPTECIASESPSFADAGWQPYAAAPSFTLSFGVGERRVYFKVRNGVGESNVASDTIFLEPRTVPVAAGTFTMGCLDSGTNDDRTYFGYYELPRHTVTLSAYRLGKFEVTYKEYCDVLNWARARGYLFTGTGMPWEGTGDIYFDGDGPGELDPVRIAGVSWEPRIIEFSGGFFSAKTCAGLPTGTIYSMDTHPVVGVSWYGAAAFCNWLSEMQGLTPCYDMASPDWPLVVAPPAAGGYRLPTEAEWERAAAWDGTRHWIYGFQSDTNPSGTANRCNDESDNPLGLVSRPHTSPVGWFNGVNVSPNAAVATMDSPSPVGAYDMSGNVEEWCGDWMSGYEIGALTNPTGTAMGGARMIRGGSYYCLYSDCRTAGRQWCAPEGAGDACGFRVSRTP